MSTANDTIRYMFNPDELMQRFNLLSEELGTMDRTHTSVTNMLDSMQWTGEAHTTCKAMNQMIGTYQNQVFDLIEGLKGATMSLCKNMEDFHKNSGLIKEIETIE